MPYWREQPSFAYPQRFGSGPMTPRSASEQTDAIMQRLAMAPGDQAVGIARASEAMGGPTGPAAALGADVGVT